VPRTAVSTPQAPAAIGPYSQAVRVGDLLFVSGQIPLDPATGQIVDGDVRAQTERVFKNIAAIVEAAGGTMDQIVRVGVFLTDLSDFAAMNDVFGKQFTAPFPARATVQVSRLPRDVKVEIDAIVSFAG
jgi:reactive intermediate/imine deaminase